MKAEVELLVLPYAARGGKSLLDVLIEQLTAGKWKLFYGAVAFAKHSGNYPDLLNAMSKFVRRKGRHIRMTFGADVFGTNTHGSDYAALEELVRRFDAEPRVEIFLYHEHRRTFHPKIYLFADEKAGRALVIIGSSNWSHGGLVDNVEANALITFDFDEPGHRESYQALKKLFETFWTEESDG